MAPTLRDTAQQLSDIPPGEGMWFWFCPGASPALLLRPMRDDPDMVAFHAAHRAVAVPAGRTPMVGIVTAEVGGRLSLGSPRASEKLLRALARWVRRNVAAHPSLAAFKDASAFRFGADRVITGRFEDPSLWQDVAAPAPLGSVAATAAAAAALCEAPESRAWFWLNESGPGGQPTFCLVPQADDPDGSRFGALVRGLSRQSVAPEAATSGTALCLANERMVLVASRETAQAARWQEALRAFGEEHIAQQPALAVLRSARLVTMVDGEPVEVQAAPEAMGADISEESRIAGRMAAGSDAWFCLVTSRRGKPRLLLAEQRETLKARLGAHDGPVVRGRVALRDGRAVFQVREARPTLQREITTWVQHYRQRWPALKVLSDATVRIRPAR